MGYWEWLWNGLKTEEAKYILLSFVFVLMMSLILASLTVVANNRFGITGGMATFIIGLILGASWVIYIVTEKVI